MPAGRAAAWAHVDQVVGGGEQVQVVVDVADVLLIPGTGSLAHIRENLAAEAVTLDDEALRTLDGVGA